MRKKSKNYYSFSVMVGLKNSDIKYMPTRQICKINPRYVNGKEMLINKKNILD
jgi:hypothetical protein